MDTEEIKSLFVELKSLLRDMDIPNFRMDSVHWLSRNMAVRNSAHANYPRAAEIVETLRAAGIAKEP